MSLSDEIWSVQKFEKIDWKKRTKILFASSVKEHIKELKERCPSRWVDKEAKFSHEIIDEVFGKELT